MVKVTLKLHQSMWDPNIPNQFTDNFTNLTILETMERLLENYPELRDLCLSKGKKKPGILYISGKTELSTLGLLDTIPEEDIEIRIVPILHGG